jgi:FkbM family methyltransferase
MWFNPTRGRFGVIALEELATADRFELEHACRAQAQPVYIGDHTALCRILGRYKFYLDTRDQGFGSNVLLDGFWEMWLTIAIARHLKPGMVAIDIGANFGYYSLLMADLVGPEGLLVAVEPNPHVTPKLRASLALNGFASRSRVIEAAAAVTNEGCAHLYATLTEPKNAAIVSPETIADPAVATITTAPNWTADAIARERGRVDFIKIDAEGAEEDIIKGLRPLLLRHKPSLVLEFNAARYANARGFLADVMSCYRDLRVVDHDGSLAPIAAETVLTERVGEDRLLFFAGAAR